MRGLAEIDADLSRVSADLREYRKSGEWLMVDVRTHWLDRLLDERNRTLAASVPII